MVDVKIISPEGRTGSVPEEDAKTLLANGYKLAPTIPVVSDEQPASVDEAYPQEAPNKLNPIGKSSAAPTTELPDNEEDQVKPDSDLASNIFNYDKSGKPFVPPAPVSVYQDHKTTIPLINSQGQEEYVDEHFANDKVASGEYSFPPSQKEVRIVDTESNKTGSIPAEDVKELLANGGGKYRLETIVDQEHKQKVDAIKRGLESDTLGTAQGEFARQFARHASPVYPILKAINPSSSEFNEAEEQVSAEHPIASDIGAVGGEVANAITTAGAAGEIAKGVPLAKNLPLARTAVEGALNALQPAAVDAINNDYKGAAENLVGGALGNVILHGIFSAGDKVLGSSAQKVVDQAEQQRVAVNTIAKEIGVPAGKVQILQDNMPRLIKSAGLTTEDTVATALKKIQKLEESGPEIGSAIKSLDESADKAAIINENLAKAKEDISNLMPEVKAQKDIINDYINDAKENGEKLSSGQALRKAIEDGSTVALSPSEKQMSKALTPILEEIESVAKKGTFADTQKLKKFVAEQTNFGGDNKFVNSLRQQSYGIIRGHLENAENSVAGLLQDTEVMQKLQDSRAAYALSKMFGDYADRTAAKEVMETKVGMLSGLHATHHGIIGVIAHTLLGPAAVPAAIGGSFLAQMVKKNAQSKVLGKAIGSFQDAKSLVIKATQNQESKIKTAVRELMRDHLTSGVITKGTAAIINAIGDWLPDGGSNKSHKAQFNELRTAVTQANTDPALFTNHLAAIVRPLRQEGLSKVADAYTEHQLRLMKVLQTILPADPQLLTAHPFSANVEVSEISPAIRTKYERALTIAADPVKLLDMIKSNTITPYDVAIAAATNPETLQKMRNALIDEALKSKPNLSYQKALSMEILMGTNLDASTNELPVIQASYAPVSPMGSPPAEKGKQKSGLSAKSQESLHNRALTVSQEASQLPNSQ